MGCLELITKNKNTADWTKAMSYELNFSIFELEATEIKSRSYRRSMMFQRIV